MKKHTRKQYARWILLAEAVGGLSGWLTPGTYYIKEVSVQDQDGIAYTPDPTIHSVTVQAAETNTELTGAGAVVRPAANRGDRAGGAAHLPGLPATVGHGAQGGALLLHPGAAPLPPPQGGAGDCPLGA